MHTAISLFSGAVDGLGIAFKQAGFYVSHHVEIDAWCCAVLAMNFPKSKIIQGDIRDVESIPYADVLMGSPPCQPWSIGTNGARAADDRHLWPEMLRLIRSSRPRCVVVENVDGGISRGLADEICLGLESEDYTPTAIGVPARAVGASHYRDRLFIVAYTERDGRPSSAAALPTAHHEKRNPAPYQQTGNTKRRAYQSGSALLGRSRLRKSSMERNAHGPASRLDRLEPSDLAGWPALQGETQKSYEPPRLISDQGTQDRNRIRALGNAIVWQQVLPVAQAVRGWLQAQDEQILVDR